MLRKGLDYLLKCHINIYLIPLKNFMALIFVSFSKPPIKKN